MTKTEQSQATAKIVEFLSSRKAIKINILENELNVPSTTITKVMNRSRLNFPKGRIPQIIQGLKAYGYSE